ncbi:MAG: hypothetical protein INF44_05805 [Thalassospira sp.]|nr:hypothetical protein [Thalassospira sp.]
MITVPLNEANKHFAETVQRALDAGETVALTREHIVVAHVVPMEEPKSSEKRKVRPLGSSPYKFDIPANFKDPIPGFSESFTLPDSPPT